MVNHYHVYEAIDRGKYPTVYKARKKKRIKYFVHKSKLLQEVQILHSLTNPNILKFCSWYETSTHLWLVLEYCAGGDLMTLLCQDYQLPEDSIHDFAHDLLKAPKYLRSNGIIYCDLKPSNILHDENGRTKLCDFKLARRLTDISKTPSSQLPQAKHGTPCCMAPELFQDGGVHSYASDFWALGCVLYECYAGRPPFVEKEFTKLVKAVLSDPYPPLPGNPSRSFASLINCLLMKEDPAERITWSDLCLHDFWITKFNTVALPPEPAFLDMIEQYAKPRLSERNGDKPLQSKTPPKTRKRDSKGVPKQDENSISGATGFESPAKNMPGGKEMLTKAFDRAVVEKKKEFSSASRAGNLLRLSRIAETNLQMENDKENYRRPLPKISENDAEVKMENNDMELNFSENFENEANDEADGSDSISTTDETLLIQTQDNDRRAESDHNTNQSDSPPDTEPCDFELDRRQIDISKTPSSQETKLYCTDNNEIKMLDEVKHEDSPPRKISHGAEVLYGNNRKMKDFLEIGSIIASLGVDNAIVFWADTRTTPRKISHGAEVLYGNNRKMEDFLEVGSIIASLGVDNAIVFGADTRTTTGDGLKTRADTLPGSTEKNELLRERVSEKIHIMEYCVMATCGNRQFNLDLVENVRNILRTNLVELGRFHKGAQVGRIILEQMNLLLKTGLYPEDVTSGVIMGMYDTNRQHQRVPYLCKVSTDNLKDVEVITTKYACDGDCQSTAYQFLKTAYKSYSDKSQIDILTGCEIVATAVVRAAERADIEASKRETPSTIGGYIRLCILLPCYGEVFEEFPLTRRRMEMDRGVSYLDYGLISEFEPMVIQTRAERKKENRLKKKKK